MENWSFIGYIAAAVSTIQLVPEVIKALQTHHLRDVSWGMLGIMLTGSSLWILYGLIINDPPLFISAMVNIAMETTLLILKRQYSLAKEPLLKRKSAISAEKVRSKE